MPSCSALQEKEKNIRQSYKLLMIVKQDNQLLLRVLISLVEESNIHEIKQKAYRLKSH